MRKCVLFGAALFLVFFTATNSPATEDWISFKPGGIEDYAQVDILSSSANGLTFHISFPGLKVGQITRGGEVYQTLSIPGGGWTHNLGWAQLPTWSRFIAVPRGAIIQVQVVELASQVLSGYHVYPAQQLPVDKAGEPEPEFVKDEEFYRRDYLYPDRLAHAKEPKIIRGCSVSSLVLFPVRYNPAKGELRVVSEMEVQIRFVGGSNYFIEPRYRSPHFEDLFENLLLNYSSLGPPPEMSGKSSTGCDFLIITHPDFQAWAESLAYWKNLSGIPTWVKTTTETGSDTGSIRTYIQNAYDSWLPPPSFLLLIGDAEFLPLFYRTIHPYDWLKTGTDLYYTTVDGSDFLPDLFPGRISVDNASQAATVIEKILRYERYPLTSPESFYDQALIAGFFQDRDYDGYADRFFLQTSERVRSFLIGRQGKDAERCYTKTSGCNPLYYYYGEPLPLGLVWTGEAAQINNAINNGVFLVNHRDHGGTVGWGDPEYLLDDLDGLANGEKLPVVFSINCETGHFDNETDDPEHETEYSGVYFCEKFLRKENGGTVGIFGHTRVSYSGLNDELCKGFYDAIWPEFDPSYPSGSSTHPINHPMHRMGAVLNFGKFWTYDKYYLTGGQGYPWGSDLESTKVTFEMGTWFGDPTMQIWTEVPQALDVSHPDTILMGDWIFSVTVSSGGTPVESVLVCLMNDEIHRTGLTDASGEVEFTLTTLEEDVLYLTATKHNCRPYQGVMTIVGATYIYGDANGDSLIDGADVVFLVNYLFNGDSAPFPYQAGDCNCDEAVDPSDVVFLINYLFKNGPEPGCS
jgi:hypothetical protein